MDLGARMVKELMMLSDGVLVGDCCRELLGPSWGPIARAVELGDAKRGNPFKLLRSAPELLFAIA